MTKLLIAVLPLVALLTGCVADVDSAEGEETTQEAAQASITSFFGSGVAE